VLRARAAHLTLGAHTQRSDGLSPPGPATLFPDKRTASAHGARGLAAGVQAEEPSAPPAAPARPTS